MSATIVSQTEDFLTLEVKIPLTRDMWQGENIVFLFNYFLLPRSTFLKTMPSKRGNMVKVTLKCQLRAKNFSLKTVICKQDDLSVEN